MSWALTIVRKRHLPEQYLTHYVGMMPALEVPGARQHNELSLFTLQLFGMGKFFIGGMIDETGPH